MNNQSYWQKTVESLNLPALKENKTNDVAIIGGGMVGVMCAYFLKDSGLNIALYEANEIGSGTSGHTTAKITLLHDLIYQTLEKNFSFEVAKEYYEANLGALENVKRIIGKEGIDCDFEETDSYIFTAKNDQVEAIEKEIDILNRLGANVLTKQHEVKNVRACVGVSEQGIFHPLKYLHQIIEICKANGIQFYEHTRIKEIRKVETINQCITDDLFEINSKHLVVATRYPILNISSLYSMKLYQQKSYLVIGKVENALQHSYLSAEDPATSYRRHNGLQLFGYSPVSETNQYQEMNELALKQHNYFSMLDGWMAEDCYSIDGIPYIGKSNNNENIYVACGFMKWGMTLSHVSSRLISDLIMERNNPYTTMFKPNRFKLVASAPHLLKHFSNSAYYLLLERAKIVTKKDSDLKPGEGGIVIHNGKVVGAYLDEQNQYHYIKPTCKHLMCRLIFNQNEKTWDCHCHGSRYDIDGNIMDAPTLKELNKYS